MSEEYADFDHATTGTRLYMIQQVDSNYEVFDGVKGVCLAKVSHFQEICTETVTEISHEKNARKRSKQQAKTRLFKRYEGGVQVDQSGWVDATPEDLAENIAERIYDLVWNIDSSFDANEEKNFLQLKLRDEIQLQPVLLDFCSGLGGNSIQFALKGMRTVGFETNTLRRSMCLHNAVNVYGVKDLVVLGDDVSSSFEELHRAIQENVDPQTIDSVNKAYEAFANFFGVDEAQEQRKKTYLASAVFMSPPWGGRSHCHQAQFSIAQAKTLTNFDFKAAFRNAAKLAPVVVLYLPPTQIIIEIYQMALQQDLPFIMVDRFTTRSKGRGRVCVVYLSRFPMPRLSLDFQGFTGLKNCSGSRREESMVPSVFCEAEGMDKAPVTVLTATLPTCRLVNSKRSKYSMVDISARSNTMSLCGEELFQDSIKSFCQNNADLYKGVAIGIATLLEEPLIQRRQILFYLHRLGHEKVFEGLLSAHRTFVALRDDSSCVEPKRTFGGYLFHKWKMEHPDLYRELQRLLKKMKSSKEQVIVQK